MIVCWGELLWDVHDASVASSAPKASAADATETLGGCACNVAFHAAQLGERVTLVSRVGNDERGDRALAKLRDAGVDTTCVTRDPNTPTAAVKVRLVGGEPEYQMLSRMDWSQLRVTSRVARVLQRCRVFVFGTLAQRTPQGFETPSTDDRGTKRLASPGQNALETALATLPENCVRVLDLNLRPTAVSAQLITNCVSQANVVKLNQHETQVLGELLQVAEPIAWLLDQPRVAYVLQTLGAAGCVVHTRGQSQRYPGAQVERAAMADPIGAGDAFCARWAVGVLRAEQPHALGPACNAFAAWVAARRGATPFRVGS